MGFPCQETDLHLSKLVLWLQQHLTLQTKLNLCPVAVCMELRRVYAISIVCAGSSTVILDLVLIYF